MSPWWLKTCCTPLMILAATPAIAAGSAATKTRRMMPQVTTAGPDSHKMPSTGGTFFSAWTRSRHALREDCGPASVMEFRFGVPNFLSGPDPSAGSVITSYLSNVTNQMQFRLDLLAEDATCSPLATVLEIDYSSLLLVSEPEFHEEWLRDGPCDATTTGSSNLRHRCQLSLTLSGGEHEIRGASCIASR